MCKTNETKTLKIALCGQTNVGKSTLLNRLIKQKISIVSPKQQTTRNAIKGILTENNTQLVFIDTPGIFRPENSMLEKQILKEAWNGIFEGELLCFMINGAKGFGEHVKSILKTVQEYNFNKINKKVNVIVVVNKSDQLNIDQKIKIAKEIDSLNIADEIFFISALKGNGCKELLKYFFSQAKNNQWLFDKEDLTDKNTDFIISEFIREKLFNLLNQEIPYISSVETEYMKYDNILQKHDIGIIVHVKKDSQKKIIIGKKGINIKKIINQSIEEIATILNTEKNKIKISLFVRS